MDEKLAQKAVIYGLTTGFGKFSDTFVPEQETAALQRNLIISHACGMGAPLPREVVRGAMLLRCNALARGNSGIRLSTLETLLAMLNRGVHPVSPEKGSGTGLDQEPELHPDPGHRAGHAGRGRGGISERGHARKTGNGAGRHCAR